MATTVTLNNTSYSIPAKGEQNWGDEVSNYLIATSTGLLQKSGGSFTLTAEVDFGANFGLKTVYIKSRGTTSSAGVVRLANAETVSWRNNANSADLDLTANASDRLEFDGYNVSTTNSTDTLTNKTIDADSNTITNIDNDEIKASAGIVYSKLDLSDSVTNSDINTNAQIAVDKLAAQTGSRVAVTDSDGYLSTSSVTTTTLGYLDATSSIQTQMDARQNDVITTRGDIVYGNSSGDAARLGIGTSGQVLGSDGTDLVWTTAAAGDTLSSATSTDNSIARYDGTNNKTIQGSGVIIDDSDNVGIGTTPSVNLHIKASSPEIRIEDSASGNGASPKIKFFENGTEVGAIGDTASLRSALMITSNTSKDIMFFTNGQNTSNDTPRMIINASGNVGIAKTTASTALHVLGVGTFQTTGTGGENTNCSFQKNDGTAVGSITTTASATNYNTTSDARLKHLHEDFNALEIVNQLTPRKYEWIGNPGVKEYGLIAQEAYEVFPQAVSEGGEDVKTNPWQVDYSKFVSILLKGIQELKTENDELKASKVSMQDQLATLSARLDNLENN